MNKAVLAIGIIFLLIGVSFTGSSYKFSISNSSYKVESEFQMEQLDTYLSTYELDTEDTIDEFIRVLNNLVFKSKWRNPILTSNMLKSIDELSDILEQIGITNDMTIAKAIPIIENNKEKLQEDGKNLFCSIDLYVFGGGCLPIYRYYKALCGIWEIGRYAEYVTINGLMGLQSCEGGGCSEDYEGSFIGLFDIPNMGLDPPVMFFSYYCTCQETWVRGDFVIFSQSNVPFVNSTFSSWYSKRSFCSIGCGIE